MEADELNFLNNFRNLGDLKKMVDATTPSQNKLTSEQEAKSKAFMEKMTGQNMDKFYPNQEKEGFNGIDQIYEMKVKDKNVDKFGDDFANEFIHEGNRNTKIDRNMYIEMMSQKTNQMKYNQTPNFHQFVQPQSQGKRTYPNYDEDILSEAFGFNNGKNKQVQPQQQQPNIDISIIMEHLKKQDTLLIMAVKEIKNLKNKIEETEETISEKARILAKKFILEEKNKNNKIIK